jgi:hypothetical protein
MVKVAQGPSFMKRVAWACGLAAFCLGVVVITGGPASATIYKWHDEEGNVGFADEVSKVPEKYRSTATSMSERELARRVPLQKEMPLDLRPIVIPGDAQTYRTIRLPKPRFEAPSHIGWTQSSARKAYVPNLGFLVEQSNHGPSQHTAHERIVYIDGKRFILVNPEPVRTGVNWADKRTMETIYGPEVRQPELDLYVGGHP